MPWVHGKGTVVTLDGDDLSIYSNSVEFTRTADSHDVTTFGRNAHVYQGGLLDGTATIAGIYDSTALTGPRAVLEPMIGTVVPMEYQPEGAGSGKPQDVVDVLVTSYAQSSPVADMVTFTVELQMSDDVDSTAQGTA